MRVAVLSAVLALISAAPAVAADPVTEVSGVDVVADLNVRLLVDVSGDMQPDTVVVSDLVGVNCGADAYKYTPHEVRQCWVWVRRRKPVVLTARASGEYGRDWNVRWSGCQVSGDGRSCTTAITSETQIAANFTRKTH